MDARTLTARERGEFKTILREKLISRMRDLSRNPMQLTILLSLILTKGSALPDKRTSLYDQYVDVFFGREAGQNAILRKHLDLLRDIHGYLAWVLHTSAESKRGRSMAGRFSVDELRAVLSAICAARSVRLVSLTKSSM